MAKGINPLDKIRTPLDKINHEMRLTQELKNKGPVEQAEIMIRETIGEFSKEACDALKALYIKAPYAGKVVKASEVSVEHVVPVKTAIQPIDESALKEEVKKLEEYVKKLEEYVKKHPENVEAKKLLNYFRKTPYYFPKYLAERAEQLRAKGVDEETIKYVIAHLSE